AVLRRILPIIVLSCPVFWMFAVFNTVSTLYVRSQGAGTTVVGVYFAVFSIPVVVLAGIWPDLPDRLGYVRAAVLALLGVAAAGIVYPLLTSVALLIVLSFTLGIVTMPILAASVA